MSTSGWFASWWPILYTEVVLKVIHIHLYLNENHGRQFGIQCWWCGVHFFCTFLPPLPIHSVATLGAIWAAFSCSSATSCLWVRFLCLLGAISLVKNVVKWYKMWSNSPKHGYRVVKMVTFDPKDAKLWPQRCSNGPKSSRMGQKIVNFGPTDGQWTNFWV